MPTKSSSSSVQKATFRQRLFAMMLDSFFMAIISIVFLGIGFFVYQFHGGPRALPVLIPLVVIWFVLAVFYEPLMLIYKGTTFGKMLMRIQIVSLKFGKLTKKQIFFRWLSRILSSILNIGYAWVLIDPTNQSWHDKIAKTYVVQLTESGKLKSGKGTKEVTPLHWILFVVVILFSAGGNASRIGNKVSREVNQERFGNNSSQSRESMLEQNKGFFNPSDVKTE